MEFKFNLEIRFQREIIFEFLKKFLNFFTGHSLLGLQTMTSRPQSQQPLLHSVDVGVDVGHNTPWHFDSLSANNKTTEKGRNSLELDQIECN